ncbi:acetate--CoA ligase family protein [Candidatus Aenigmatarchaeota archaeon]
MKVFAEREAEKFLKKYLPIANSIITKDIKKAENFAKKNKYNVVLKLISKQALHKTDIGGVKIVKNKQEFERGFNEITKITKKKKISFEGILIQEFVKGQEIIIGLKKDKTFGHAIMLGTGGIFVEVIKDVSFRVCPIDMKDAEEMIDELKFKKLLLGFRGSKPVKMIALKKALVAVSKIPLKNKSISELDINPFMINEKVGKVADARIVFE